MSPDNPMPPTTVLTVDARVVENRDLGADHSLLSMRAPEVAAAARPGQFVNVAFPGLTDPLLPRPFAVFDARAPDGPAGGEIDILFKVVGRGTRLMDGLSPGDRLRLVGPLGRGWRARETGPSVLVAGGTGWGALGFLASELVRSGREVRAVWGMCDSDLFPAPALVERSGVEIVYATEDGTCGFCGTSVDCLRGLIEDDLAPGTVRSIRRNLTFVGGDVALYGAGPVPMLRALAELAREHDLPCQVSLEARMACGIGVCRGCVVDARLPHPGTGLRRRAVCADGPVFDAADIDWEGPR